MSRVVIFCGLLVVCVAQSGCMCNMGGCSSGCGRAYWGAYADNPPCGDPCDCQGNWTGGRGQCGCNDCCDSPYPWMRAQMMRGNWLSSLLNCGRNRNSLCTGASCSEPCEPTCEPTCEPACGEPGCGVTATGGEMIIEQPQSPNVPQGPALQPTSSRSPVRVRGVSNSRTNMVHEPSYAPYGSAKCNCGRVH